MGAVNPKVVVLVRIASDPAQLAQAQHEAHAYVGTGGSTCSATLSFLLRAASIDVGVTPWAETLAHVLLTRGWDRVAVDDTQAGDVCVCADLNNNGAADHIWLCLRRLDARHCQCADNQGAAHKRALDGSDGRTATVYGLRAPG